MKNYTFKKILQWNFFALPPTEKNNSKVAGSKINKRSKIVF